MEIQVNSTMDKATTHQNLWLFVISNRTESTGGQPNCVVSYLEVQLCSHLQRGEWGERIDSENYLHFCFQIIRWRFAFLINIIMQTFDAVPQRNHTDYVLCRRSKSSSYSSRCCLIYFMVSPRILLIRFHLKR